MKPSKILGLIVATIALAVFAVSPVSAFATINDVVVNGVEFDDSDFASDPVAGVFAGKVIPVRVTFTANDSIPGGFEEDVRISARILGEPGLSEVTERFDVLEGSTYSRLLDIELPFDIDPDERFILEVTVESNAREADSVQIQLEIQRSSFELEILTVETDTEVSAGENLVIDVVVKNRGRQEAEDTFVRAGIPELGISRMAFLEDLSSEDQSDPDKEDSEFGRVFLKIPGNTPAGVYTLEVEAFNDDSTTLVTKRVVVGGAGEVSRVISSVMSKSFGVGEEETYSITIVNAGKNIQVYELIIESDSALDIELDEPIVAVPAGTSKTVRLSAKASEEGRYNFAVNVHSNGDLVTREEFVANASGNSVAVAGNATVLVTVILAIIFVVLLVVLIVLLTRKPEKAEETGESYY